MKKIFKSLGLYVPTHYCGDKFINCCKRNLILWKLNSIQMKILNDITSNLNWIELKYIEGNLNSIIRRKRPRCTILFVIAYNYMSLQPFWQLLTNIGNFWSFYNYVAITLQVLTSSTFHVNVLILNSSTNKLICSISHINNQIKLQLICET
jgi:hypothetical protein